MSESAPTRPRPKPSSSSERQAGGETASELRKQGYAGASSWWDETHVRTPPPVVQGYLNGTRPRKAVHLPPAGLEKARIEFIGGVRASARPRGKQLHLSDGRVWITTSWCSPPPAAPAS